MPETGGARSDAEDEEEQAARVLRFVRTRHTQGSTTPECTCAILPTAEPSPDEPADAGPKTNVTNLLNQLKDVLKQKNAVSGSLMAKLDWMERECHSVITDLQQHAAPPLIASLHNYNDTASSQC